ncbi:hypothetical protein HDU83_007019 [Entophlyctis luteolus]|nr:hypothetical protein HDU83_007019 [Entophlyctis luteolus]
MSVSTRYLRCLFYVLLFRCDASLESVWRLVEDLENEDSTNTTAHLHGQSLAILLEAELRIAHGRRIIKLSSNDLIAMKTQKYRSVFDYIQKSKMLLTVDCCRLLMREFAMFQDGVGATKLLELMRSQNVVPDSEIYQKAILAIVRKKSLTAQAVSLVEEMKAQNIKVPVPILSSMARWSFKKDFDNDYGDIVYWIERIFADNLNPNFHVLTVMVQYYFKVVSERNAIPDKRFSDLMERVFAHFGSNFSSKRRPVTSDDVAARFSSILFSQQQECAAAYVILINYLISRNNLEGAVAAIRRARSTNPIRSTRVYAEILRAAVLAKNQAVLDSVVQLIIADEIVLDRQILHKLVRADFERGDFDSGFELLKIWLESRDTPRSSRTAISDEIITDLMDVLSSKCEYQLVFKFYEFAKNYVQFGPKSTSKLISLTEPKDGVSAYASVENPALCDAIAELTGAPNDSLHEPISKFLPTHTDTFHPHYSALDILSEYLQQPSSRVDLAVCSAVVRSLIVNKMPKSIIPEIFHRFQAANVKIDSQLLVLTTEAFAKAGDAEGTQWTMSLLRKLQLEAPPLPWTTQKDVWRRMWLAHLRAASKSGDLDASEAAVRELCALCLPNTLPERVRLQKLREMDDVLTLDFSVLGSDNRKKVLQAVDHLLIANVRKGKTDRVKRLLVLMREQDAVPSLSALKLMFNKGLEEHANDVMGPNWLLSTILAHTKDVAK